MTPVTLTFDLDQSKSIGRNFEVIWCYNDDLMKIWWELTELWRFENVHRQTDRHANRPCPSLYWQNSVRIWPVIILFIAFCCVARKPFDGSSPFKNHWNQKLPYSAMVSFDNKFNVVNICQHSVEVDKNGIFVAILTSTWDALICCSSKTVRDRAAYASARL